MAAKGPGHRDRAGGGTRGRTTAHRGSGSPEKPAAEKPQFVTERKSGRFRYFRFPGSGDMVALPSGVPYDHPDFVAAYTRCKDKMNERRARIDDLAIRRRRTVGALRQAYITSRRFQDLAPSTRRARGRLIDRIVRGPDPDGADDISEELWSHVTRPDVQADIDTCTSGAAKERLKTWRALAKYAIHLEWQEKDPTKNVELPRHRTRKYKRWTNDDVMAFTDHWPVGTQQRLAFELLYWTGLRVCDVVRIGWSHIEKDENGVSWLVIKQQKGFDAELVEVPILGRLADAIASADPNRFTFLETVQGRARSAKGWAAWFANARDQAGVGKDKSAHGIRHDVYSTGADADVLPEDGQRAAGHKTVAQQMEYRQQADRRRQVMRFWEGVHAEREKTTGEHIVQTAVQTSCKPEVKVLKINRKR